MTGAFTTYDHPDLGELVIASDGEAVTGLWMVGQKYFMAGMEGELARDDGLPVLRQAREWLDRYFADDPPDVDELPLAPRGTPFQLRVWGKLALIPYGSVRTYAEVADELAREDGRERGSARAVGTANGRNPISIIVPCHRLVGSDGSLAGYAGGVAKKLWLLRHEHVDVSGFHVPKKGTAL